MTLALYFSLVVKDFSDNYQVSSCKLKDIDFKGLIKTNRYSATSDLSFKKIKTNIIVEAIPVVILLKESNMLMVLASNYMHT